MKRRKRVLETFYVAWNFVMNVNCDCNKNICEAIITITFPVKQTTMKHDMNKFNLTKFECRIQNLINLLVNRKLLNVFSCFLHSKYHKSIMPPLQCDFFNAVYFFLWIAIFSIYLLPAEWMRRMKSTLAFDTLQANPKTD